MIENRIIGLTGGIGSGKSIVRDIAQAIGIPVYDCDSRAKVIIDRSERILAAIGEDICPEAITVNGLNRSILAARIFSSEESRSKLNMMVHAEVIADVKSWAVDKPVSLVESAILYTSGLDLVVTEVWVVVAPEEIRMTRIQQRNPNLTPSEIRARMASQAGELNHFRRNPTHAIINDGVIPVLPQIESIL